MKYIYALLLVFLVIFSVCSDDNGQPGCKTDTEMVVRKYRNFWDPTKYWLCSVRDEPATLANCQQEFMFQDEIKDCVHNSKWVWTSPVQPPSKP